MYGTDQWRGSLWRALLGIGLALATASGLEAQGPPVKVGELNSYSRMAVFSVPYRNGMQLGQDEINANGGVLGGRKLEIVFRDDGGTPVDAVRVADELLTRENVSFLAGTFLSNVGLAVADLANQRKTLFLATEPLTDAITMGQGNRYTFRVRPSTYMQTKMLVEAVKGKGVKRWAVVAPNYEYGQSAVANFKKLIKAATPDAEIVAEQFPTLTKIDAGATVAALENAKPDGIFNALFGADLTVFVREGNTRGLFEKRTIASLLTGEPEYLAPLGEETPEGWIVTGYPADAITEPAHKAFIDAYRAKWKDAPRLGSVLGYVVAHMIKDMLDKAGSTETEKLLASLRGETFNTILGPITMRALDQQSTMGAWVGETSRNGKLGSMKNWSYQDGANYMFSEADVKAARKE
ncbi:MAG TPA: ABC transporter substrate-binding protein [Hyphomicrobiaceae bacterium]|nr:ABC transporter substrate-binding protein [Hyphomicrobiaceae bacterium]